MIVKVCGMKYLNNIADLANIPIDLMGLIFYPKSPRFVQNITPKELDNLLGNTIKKVGVFVNSHFEFIAQQAMMYKLNFIQLHGNESPEFCQKINRELRLPVIKSFSISQPSDMAKVNEYEYINGYFLFDTKTENYGGSGKKFDWNILSAYQGKIPFLLSGGIAAEDAKVIKSITYPQFAGVDINSCFEIEAGLKNIELIEKFVNEIKNEQNK